MMTKKPRILIATGLYPPDIGGPATYTKLLENELPKRGIDVKVLSFGEVRHLPVGIRHLIYLIKLYVASYGCFCILAQDTVSVGFPSVFVSKIMRKKFLVRVPGDYAWEQGSQRFGVSDTIDEFQHKKYSYRVEFLRSVQRYVIARADRIITPSNYFNRLVQNWTKTKLPVVTVYNGIEIQEYKKIPYYDRDKRIISSGRLVPWKGFSTLIELMNKLSDWHLDIVGDGPLKNELVEYAKKSGVEERVTFHGRVPREKLNNMLRRSRVFVLNTTFESFSFQTVEAMAQKTPAIVTNIGSLPELIENGKTGFLFEPNDTEAIQQYISILENDSSKRETVIEEAYKKAHAFSIENTVTQLTKLLKEL